MKMILSDDTDPFRVKSSCPDHSSRRTVSLQYVFIKSAEKHSGDSRLFHNAEWTDVRRIRWQPTAATKTEVHSYLWLHRPMRRYEEHCSVPSRRREPFRWRHEHQSYPDRDLQHSPFYRWPEELEENDPFEYIDESELLVTCVESFRMYFAFAMISILIFNFDLAFGMNPGCLAIWMMNFNRAWFM